MRTEPKMPAAVGQLYEAAEVALDDGESLYRNCLDAGHRQLTFFDDYLVSLRNSTDAVANKAMAMAAQNADAASHFARRLMRARNAGEVLTLQLEFYRAQAAAFAGQVIDLSQTAFKAAELMSR